MKTDPAQILVNRLLEADEDKIDWSPDPQAEQIRYQNLDVFDNPYPLSTKELTEQTENGTEPLRGKVEVPSAMWDAWRTKWDTYPLEEYVSKLVTGNMFGLSDIDCEHAYGKATGRGNVAIYFTATWPPIMP